jgi:hypothetical protein
MRSFTGKWIPGSPVALFNQNGLVSYKNYWNNWNEIYIYRIVKAS